jgi:endonuclease/exonuclease/phosphatase family metal-dependent hydrolase
MRVVTFNVLGPANPDWKRRKEVSAAALRSLNPDIVALQEVPIGSAPQAIDELLGPGFHVRGFARTDKDGGGAVLATRRPHRMVDEIDQRCTPRAHALPWASTLIVRVDAPEGAVLVAHHKPSWQFGAEYEREQQALAAARLAEQYADQADHVIVLGDFDATPDAASMRFWRGRRSLEGLSVCYQDAWATAHPDEPGFTFTPANPLVRAGQMPAGEARRIDYILIRAGDHGPTLSVSRCDLVLDHPVDGVWASDHFGVVADLTLPEHAPASWSTIPY